MVHQGSRLKKSRRNVEQARLLKIPFDEIILDKIKDLIQIEDRN